MKVLSSLKETKTTSFLIILHTILVAVFCDVKSLNYALTYGGFVGEGAMAIIYPIVVTCIFAVSFVRKRSCINVFTPYSLFILLYLICFYSITLFFIGAPRVSIPFFGVFVISAFLIPQISNVKTKLFIKLIMCIPFFAVFKLNQIFAITEIWKEEISMDASYAFLLPIIANIVYLKFYLKNEKFVSKIITVVFSVINSIFLGYVLLFGSRGPVLCLVLLPIFWYLYKMKHDQNGVKVRRGRLSFFIILIIFFFLFGEVFINWIISVLESFDISISALNKIVSSVDDGDFSNGRNELYLQAINGFLENPLLGNGLDRFDARYPGADYPHNFILQALYDGGLFLTFVLLLPLLHRLRIFLRKCSYDEYVVFSMFFFASVPGALFSQDLWNNAILWLSFGLLYSKRFAV